MINVYVDTSKFLNINEKKQEQEPSNPTIQTFVELPVTQELMAKIQKYNKKNLK